MRKRFFSVSAVIAISGSLFLSSCIGTFNLSSNLLAWNQTVDNKIVNAVLFVVLSPVYGATLLADAFIFNTIEFWTGENPIEAGIVTKVQGEKGIYTVETLKNGYKIENPDGQEMKLVYDKQTNVWSSVVAGKTDKLIKIKDNKQAIVYLPNGEEMQIELSQAGLLACKQAVENSIYLANK